MPKLFQPVKDRGRPPGRLPEFAFDRLGRFPVTLRQAASRIPAEVFMRTLVVGLLGGRPMDRRRPGHRSPRNRTAFMGERARGPPRRRRGRIPFPENRPCACASATVSACTPRPTGPRRLCPRRRAGRGRRSARRRIEALEHAEGAGYLLFLLDEGALAFRHGFAGQASSRAGVGANFGLVGLEGQGRLSPVRRACAGRGCIFSRRSAQRYSSQALTSSPFSRCWTRASVRRRATLMSVTRGRSKSMAMRRMM